MAEIYKLSFFGLPREDIMLYVSECIGERGGDVLIADKSASESVAFALLSSENAASRNYDCALNTAVFKGGAVMCPDRYTHVLEYSDTAEIGENSDSEKTVIITDTLPANMRRCVENVKSIYGKTKIYVVITEDRDMVDPHDYKKLCAMCKVIFLRERSADLNLRWDIENRKYFGLKHMSRDMKTLVDKLCEGILSEGIGEKKEGKILWESLFRFGRLKAGRAVQQAAPPLSDVIFPRDTVRMFP